MTLTTISGKRVIKGFELNDPFPLLVEDSADIIKFFKNSKIVPYSYTDCIVTGNSLRPLLSKISRLSHTQNACITKKVELGFSVNCVVFAKRMRNFKVDINTIFTVFVPRF